MEGPMNPHLEPHDLPEKLRLALAYKGLTPAASKLPKRVASVALVVHQAPEGLALLWIRRATNPQDTWSGHMGFPGGRQEEGDRNSRHTAERETQEEIGLSLDHVGEYLGPLHHRPVHNRTGLAPFKVVPHVYWVPELPPLAPDPSEVAEVTSIPLAHMLDPAQATQKHITWKEQELDLPAIRFGEDFLWGLSLQIWQDLRSRLEQSMFFQELQVREPSSG
jgi:8-oxo-dGTP pyrophosphatase MutT (NUDIX family)